jgi:hypothetical protein
VLSLFAAEGLVGGEVELEPIDIQAMREEDLCLQPGLDNPPTLEVVTGPIEDLSDGPSGSQRSPLTRMPETPIVPYTIAES